MLQLLTEWN